MISTRDGLVGLVDYATEEDLLYAIRKLDDTEFENPFDRTFVRVKEYTGQLHLEDGGRDRYRSRSRSRSLHRSRSRCDFSFGFGSVNGFRGHGGHRRSRSPRGFPVRGSVKQEMRPRTPPSRKGTPVKEEETRRPYSQTSSKGRSLSFDSQKRLAKSPHPPGH